MGWHKRQGSTPVHNQGKIADLSKRKWGRRDYTWLVCKTRVKLIRETKLWQNYVSAWYVLNKYIKPSPPHNWAKMDLPLWSLHVEYSLVEGEKGLGQEKKNV